MRILISSGSPLEPEIGFSRAVRIGSLLAVAGTAPLGSDGATVAPGDVYAQTKRCLEIIEETISKAGLGLRDVLRTRIMLTNISDWREAAKAHAEIFSDIRPACTFVEISSFIDPDWLVEIEADCMTDNS